MGGVAVYASLGITRQMESKEYQLPIYLPVSCSIELEERIPALIQAA